MNPIVRKIKYTVNKLMERKISIPLHPLKNGVIRIGTHYGGWVIPQNFLNEKSIYYGVGAGEDISFDVGIVNQYNCQAHIFDPTPRAIKHFDLLSKNTAAGLPTPANSNPKNTYSVSPQKLELLKFYPVGLWNEDTTLKFFSPADESGVSHSAVNLQRTEKYFEAKVKQLPTIMQECGHDRIDLLKLDIEGAEYQVIENIVAHQIIIGVLCIEFDETARNNFDSKYISRIQGAIDSLLGMGYLGVFIDEDFNFTFVHKSIYPSLA